MKKHPSLLTSFYRSQIAAFIATIVDFSTLLFCVEILKIWYGTATAIAAALGACANFLIGRYWSFGAHEHSAGPQFLRYALVSTGSLVLNSCGVVFLTEHFKIPYWVSKIITALVVGICYNFVLHRIFVFKKVHRNENTTT